MPHLGTLRDFRFTDKDVDDIRGADVYGRNDEKLGEINDIIFDHHSGEIRYVVVDTGGWLSSKEFVVPADRLEQRRGHDKDFFVDLTQEQIERFPAYDEKKVETDRDWKDYESRYRDAWETGPVLHKENSTHAITPEATEMPAPSGSGSEDLDVEPTRIAGVFPEAGANPNKTRLRPSGTASRAEDSKRPGQSFNMESPSREELNLRRDRENLRDESDIGYGDVGRTRVPDVNTQELPPSYRESMDGMHDEVDLHRPYPVQEGRSQRFQAFEDHLRRNRVDVTASCRSCEMEKDRAA